MTLPGYASIQPGIIVMIRSPSEDNCILKTIENFTAIIYNNLETKSTERLLIGLLLSYVKTNVKLVYTCLYIHFPGMATFFQFLS